MVYCTDNMLKSEGSTPKTIYQFVSPWEYCTTTVTLLLLFIMIERLLLSYDFFLFLRVAFTALVA